MSAITGSGLSTAEERILEGLNEAQREAVVHGEGPLLIIAGAGTGKTTVLTRRIAHLIATKRARPEEILALTFTEKAAAEMAERVDQLIPWGYAETAISTFHAFGDRVLRESALEAGLDPQFRVLSQPEQVIFLRERLFRLPLDRFRPLGDPTRHLAALATLVSRAKDEDVSPGAVPRVGRGAARRRRHRTERAGRGRGRTSSSRPSTRRTRGCSARRGSWTSATRSTGPSPSCASDPPSSRGCAAATASSWWTSSRTRTTPSSRCSSCVAGETGQPHRGGRRRPGHLPLARRRRRQPARLPAALPGRARGRAGGELPLDAGDPRHGGAPHRLQQPLPPRGDRGDRQAAPLAAARAVPPSATRTSTPSRPRPTASRR